MKQSEDMREALKGRVCAAISQRAKFLLDVCHEVHATPELAFEEWKTSDILVRAAEAAGLEVKRGAFGLPTALASEFGHSDITLAIISEYDALPEIGHACGHNIIATAGLGAALALRDLGDELPGAVRWLGTPAEERGCGKEIMARNGAFDGATAALMVHPAGIDAKGFRAGCLCELEAIFSGRSAHPAINPSDALNALDAAVAAYQAIAAIRQHLPFGDQVNVILSEGGRAPNVIPDRAVLRIFARAPSAMRLSALKRRIASCMEAGALGAGCRVECKWDQADYLDFKLNEPLADAYEANARVLGREEFIPVERLPVGGGDIGNVSNRIPTLHPLISCAPRTVRLHDPDFATWAGSERGDRAVIDGAKALAMTAIDFFTDISLRTRVAEAFARHAEESAEAVATAWRGEGIAPTGLLERQPTG